MSFIKRRYREFILLVVNHFLPGTRFFDLKRILLNSCGIRVGRDSKIVGPFRVSNCSNIIIGSNCWIGSDFTVLGDGEVVVDDNCDFAPQVTFISGSHEIGSEIRRAGKGILFSIQVDHGCWIGAKACLQGNIEIGKSSIVGSCSLVLDDVKPNCIVAGVPARVIKEL